MTFTNSLRTRRHSSWESESLPILTIHTLSILEHLNALELVGLFLRLVHLLFSGSCKTGNLDRKHRSKESDSKETEYSTWS